MKKKHSSPLWLVLTLLVAAVAAYSFWLVPSVGKKSVDSFSSERVAADIEVISKERHSVAHPEARARVREYLINRLTELGSEPRVHHFDSVQARGYTFDVDNVVADFNVEGATSTLLMVAHYDSRYPWVPVKDTTCSYGAADDGYGVGVILETISQALQYKSQWKQNLRVLFTDAEEVGMEGMKAAYAHNREEIFGDVGLVINIEARGPYGPALLFETSSGSDKLLKLYSKESKYHHTYSLTNVVYGFMPNFTDFTIVKDEIPGMNFSTIADINHYHTTEDNFSNIDTRSIQHYGEQVEPIVREYLTGEQYADKDFFRDGKDGVFFTIPVLGLFHFSKTAYMIINIVVVLLLLAFLLLNGCKWGKSFKYAGITLGAAVGALAFGELMSWLGCLVSGAKFKPFGIITGMQFDNALMIVCALILLVSLVLYCKKHHGPETLFGSYLCMAILSLVLFFAIGESMLVLIPLTFSLLGIFLWQLTEWKLFLLAGIGLTMLHAFSFLYSLAMALTVGALGAVLFVAVFDLMAVIPLCRHYLK